MGLVFSDADLDVMMQVKRVFNPDGLLNPSKIFPSLFKFKFMKCALLFVGNYTYLSIL